MADLYNLETGLLEDLPEDELEKAYLGGTHFLKKDEIIPLIAPDNSTRDIPAEEVASRLQLGYRFERKEEQLAREFRADIQDEGLLGSVKTFGKQFVDEAAFGLLEFGADRLQDKDAVLRRQIEKEERPIANMFGGIAGAATTLGYGTIWKGVNWAGNKAAQMTAEIAQQMGPKIANSFAAKAAEVTARGAAEGALVSAPYALTEATLGDHETVAEGLMAGMDYLATGAALGGAFEVGSRVITSPVSAALRYAKGKITSEKVQNIADKLYLGGFHLKAGELKVLNRNLGDGTEDVTASEFRKITQEAGIKPWETGDYAKNLKLVEAEREKIGAEMNLMREKFTTDFGPVVPWKEMDNALGEVTKQFDTEFGRRNGSFGMAKASQAMYRRRSDEFSKARDGSGAITVEELFQIKKEIGAEAWKKGGDLQGVVENPGGVGAYNIVNDKLEQTMKVLAEKGDEPLKRSYAEVQKAYGKVKAILPALTKAQDRIGGHNVISFGDFVSGAAFGSLGGAPAALAGIGLNKLAKAYGNQAAERLLTRSAKMLEGVQDSTYQAIDRALGLAKTVGARSVPLSVGIMARYLGDDSGTKAEQFNQVARDISNFSADANLASNSMAELLGPLGQAAPMITEAMNSKTVSAINYLGQEMPKPLTPNNPLDPQTFIPSDRQISQFERKMQIAMSPMSVFGEMERGTLTREHVHALENVYPKLLEQIRGRILTQLSVPGRKLSPKVKHTIAILMDEETIFKKSGAEIQMLQENFERKTKPKPKANSKITEASRTAPELNSVLYE